MKWALAILIFALLLLIANIIQAQTGGGYDLYWNTIDSGGYTFSTGGGYQLGGTIGQPDAGVLSSGAYTLIGGFWSEIGQVLAQFQIYLPLIKKNY
jgi:hypothetical protein